MKDERMAANRWGSFQLSAGRAHSCRKQEEADGGRQKDTKPGRGRVKGVAAPWGRMRKGRMTEKRAIERERKKEKQS